MIIQGKNINLRSVEVDDAEFILSMRINPNKNKYLSQVKNSLKLQIQWLEEYKKREIQKEEFYFIIESKNAESLGLIRAYDFKEDSFSWGSWMIKKGAPFYTGIESALMIYDFGFNYLGFLYSHFDVRKNNEKVIAFHTRFGAHIVFQDDINYYFTLDKQTYLITKNKFKKYINNI